MRIFSSYSVRSRLAAGRPSDRDRAVVVVPVFRRRGGELVEDPIEPLIERQFDRDGIDHRRRLGKRNVRGAEGLGAAPKGDQAGRVEIGPDIEPPVGLDEVVLEVLGRRAGIVAETAVGQQPQRVIQPLRPQLERRTNHGDRRADRRRGRREHVVVISQVEVDRGIQRERADADAELVSPLDRAARRQAWRREGRPVASAGPGSAWPASACRPGRGQSLPRTTTAPSQGWESKRTECETHESSWD